MEAKRLLRVKVNRWLLVSGVVLGLGLGGLVAACSGTETASTSASKTATTQAVASTMAAVTPTATPAVSITSTSTLPSTTSTTEAGLEIQIVRDIPYMTQREGWIPPVLDVYAPKQAGPWPLVVMLYGGAPGANIRKTYLQSWAIRVAQRGAVVFVPDSNPDHDLWTSSPTPATVKELREAISVLAADAAAAVRFARAEGARYGGDPENLTLFGHSGGANKAAMVAFNGISPSEGALAGAGSSLPESLVLFDGDYLLAAENWDYQLNVDPSLVQDLPWQYLGRRVDFPITILGSSDPSLYHDLGDPWAEDSWLAVRDPSGELRRGLEKLGALDGDVYLNESGLQLLAERLKADGDTITYIRLTDSSHVTLGPKGMESFLDALVSDAKP